MKEKLKQLARLKQVELAAINVCQRQLFYIKTLRGHVLNDGNSLTVEETVEFLESLQRPGG